MKIVQYKKLMLLALLGSLSLQVYAMDDDIDAKKDRAFAFKNFDEPTKRQVIEYKMNEMTPEDQQGLFHFLNLSSGGPKDVNEVKSYIADLPSGQLTAVNMKIDQLRDQSSQKTLQKLMSKELEKEKDDEPSDVAGPSEVPAKDTDARQDYNDEEIEKLIKNRPFGVYHAPELPPKNPDDRLKWAQSRQIEHQLNREKEVFGLQDRALAAQVAGLERGESEDAELFEFKKRMITAQTARVEREEKEQRGISKLKKRALNAQIQREEAALKRENPSFGEFVKRPEFVISMAVTLGEPIYRLCVERYGNAVLGLIEEKLGFGPSEQEKQFMMTQMMNNAALKSRLTRAELNEKELKVSILRAVLKKHEIDAEKDELQLEAIKRNKELLDDIVDLTRQKIKLGPNFPASEKKKLEELKALYKEGQMINKELQDLKNSAGSGIPISGVA